MLGSSGGGRGMDGWINGGDGKGGRKGEGEGGRGKGDHASSALFGNERIRRQLAL